MALSSSPENGTMLQPRISVCMATYNGERFVARQLQTILSQLGATDEIVISDDSSTDGTLKVIESFEDKRIRLFRGQTFRSPIYNFENALKQARGKIIFLSDQDDEWVDGWVEVAVAELSDASLVVCDAYMIDAEGNLRSSEETKIYHGVRKPGILQNLYRNGYIGCCCAFRREILDAALPFPLDLPWHDWWLGLVADAFFTSRFIEKKMIRYRRHGENVSSTGEPSTTTLAKKLRMRWRIATELIRRFLDRGWRGKTWTSSRSYQHPGRE